METRAHYLLIAQQVFVVVIFWEELDKMMKGSLYDCMMSLKVIYIPALCQLHIQLYLTSK